MQIPTVLVRENDRGVSAFDRAGLGACGYLVKTVRDDETLLHQVRDALPDLILLDLTQPTMDTFDLLHRLRADSTVPVIVMVARHGEAEMIRVLDLGADDYVIKPCSPEALSARIRAIRRRGRWTETLDEGVLTVDAYLQIDFAEHEVHVGGQRVTLRPTEFRLLYQLVQNAGHTLPFQTLLARVWGPEYHAETQYIHLYVTYLRQKIEPDPHRPRYILTRRGVGYRFQPPLAPG